MGATNSKGQKNGDESLKALVHGNLLTERKEVSSYGSGDGCGHSSSRNDAKCRWCRVKGLVDKYKLSCKFACSKKRSNRLLEEVFLPESIKNTRDVLRLLEERNGAHRKYVDRISNIQTINFRDVEQVGKRRWKAPAGGEDKVVLYFTSLTIIRKTFDDCYVVKLILGGFRVLVDERDISMHAPFRQELQDLLGMPIRVPSLFIAGKYIGGVEEIQQLHEVGELAKYLQGFSLHTCASPCHGCGNARFIPCPNCDGSRKVFTEDKGGQPWGLFVRCPECNENGLIRCPVCCR